MSDTKRPNETKVSSYPGTTIYHIKGGAPIIPPRPRPPGSPYIPPSEARNMPLPPPRAEGDDRVPAEIVGLTTIEEKLRAMRTVGINWDGEGAYEPRQDIISGAQEFWRVLRGCEPFPEPWVTATPAGCVLFRWVFGPHRLEAEVQSRYVGEFRYIDRRSKEAVTGKLALYNHGEDRASFALVAILSAMWRASSEATKREGA